MFCDGLEGWDAGDGRKVGGRVVQEGGDMCILIAYSLCCTAKANSTL